MKQILDSLFTVESNGVGQCEKIEMCNNGPKTEEDIGNAPNGGVENGAWCPPIEDDCIVTADTSAVMHFDGGCTNLWLLLLL